MTPEGIARRVVAAAAWFMLGLLVFAFISASIPGIGAALETPGSVGIVAIKGLTLVIGIVLLTGWGAAIWHAAVNPGFRSAGQRAVVIALIVVGTPASLFFYYFGYLLWASPNVHSRAAV